MVELDLASISAPSVVDDPASSGGEELPPGVFSHCSAPLKPDESFGLRFPDAVGSVRHGCGTHPANPRTGRGVGRRGASGVGWGETTSCARDVGPRGGPRWFPPIASSRRSGDNAAESARRTLQVYVSALRGALAKAGIGGDTIVREGSGYRLALPVEALDHVHFGRLLSEGQGLLGGGTPAQRAKRFEMRSALACPALGDLADIGAVAGEAQRLEELRLVSSRSA